MSDCLDDPECDGYTRGPWNTVCPTPDEALERLSKIGRAGYQASERLNARSKPNIIARLSRFLQLKTRSK